MSRPRKKVYLFGDDETEVGITRFVLEWRLFVTTVSSSSEAHASVFIAPEGYVVSKGPETRCCVPDVRVIAADDKALLLKAVKDATVLQRGPKMVPASSFHRCSGQVAETRAAA